jgi:hypothetical protein
MTIETEEVFDEAKGWARIVRDAVLQPIPLAGVMVAVVAVALVVWWSSRNPEHVARRWEAAGAATETDSFSRRVKPARPDFITRVAAYFAPEAGPCAGESHSREANGLDQTPRRGLLGSCPSGSPPPPKSPGSRRPRAGARYRLPGEGSGSGAAVMETAARGSD